MIVKIILAVIIVGVVLYYSFPLIQVIGDSMYPTYFDGEIIVGTRIYKKSNLKVDDVIIYHAPTDGKIVIKRIHSIRTDYWGELQFFCVGDNLDHSYDSREYGFVSSKNLVCKVIDQRRNMNNVCN